MKEAPLRPNYEQTYFYYILSCKILLLPEIYYLDSNVQVRLNIFGWIFWKKYGQILPTVLFKFLFHVCYKNAFYLPQG